MRTLVVLLAAYIGFLTVQPMVSPVYVCELKIEKKQSRGSCSKTDAKDCERQDPGKCPASGICNPFNQCTCCLAAPETSFYLLKKSTTSVDFNSFASANLLSNYVADCFRPPEVV